MCLIDITNSSDVAFRLLIGAFPDEKPHRIDYNTWADKLGVSRADISYNINKLRRMGYIRYTQDGNFFVTTEMVKFISGDGLKINA